MPSATEATPAPCAASPQAVSPQAVSADPSAGTAFQLAQASRALWSATLSLMVAFMHTPAPAHRYLLARRIAANFGTLAAQDCFDRACRDRFVRLAQRWQANAAQFTPVSETPERPRGLLRFLF